MSRLLLVCVGGAIGSGVRYLVAIALPLVVGTTFPWATLAVNITGSFLLAAIAQIGTDTELISPGLRIMLTSGVMGGFTTYSTFNYETMSYFSEGAWLMGGLNVAATLAGCLIAGIGGMAAARWMFGA